MSRQVLQDLDFNNGTRILNLPNGVANQEPATVAQLKSAIEGLAFKDDVRVASQANVNLAAPGASIDGVALAVNDRVLIKSQTAPAENGIYIFNGAAVPMTRSEDMNSSLEFNAAVVPVLEGTSAGIYFRQTAITPTVGTTAIVFVNFQSAVASASETTQGIAEIATQAETDAGIDDLRFVTPAKLANYAGRLKKFAQLIGDGSATSYAVTHNLNSRDVQVEVYRNSGNFDSVIVEVQRTSVNQVTILFAQPPALDAFKVVVVS